ncbi:hypothetical protein HELRODRAFT_109533 [Helobdella robusta]|uniref:Sorting nexin n=1 Tax=Helobdella robusta TaxID=6412 RepID=T1EEU5_HELRO|nr:hypothetical protein HELRODRAFT_109533 [Helobdella robusta]ESO09196.1 hypothetical protein HELRODRAFT_109533 [Helobdella robusta]
MSGGMFQAVALYDFHSQSEKELSFQASDIVTILSTDIGNGWWEARNGNGLKGLVPQSYFKFHCPVPASRLPLPEPPFPLPASSSTSSSSSASSSASSQSSIALPPRPPPKPVRVVQTYISSSSSSSSPQHHHRCVPCNARFNAIEVLSDNEDWDEDDDDDNEDYNVITEVYSSNKCPTSTLEKNSKLNSCKYDDFFEDDDEEDEEDLYHKHGKKLVGITTGSADMYLFNMDPPALPSDVKKINIYDSYEGPVWSLSAVPSMTCKLGSPRKEKKYKGMKSYTTYQVLPSTTNTPVYRRYKQFDWLHDRLVEKFSTLIIPHLPEKQISGRFEEEFIRGRLRKLSLWMSRMCKHPIISQSEAFIHFIHCNGNVEVQWKAGKRQIERDKYKGAYFFYTVEPPGIDLDPIVVEIQMDKFGRFIRSMEDSIKHLSNVCQKNGYRYRLKFHKEFLTLGKSYEELAKSFELDNRKSSRKLSSAIQYTGKTYIEIALLFSVQPSKDLVNLMEGLQEYRGILSVFPDVLLVQRSTTNKIQENAGQLTRQEVNKIQSRADVITYTVLAEIQHFQVNRVTDFSNYMQAYLQGQIDFFKQITSKLEKSLNFFDNV